MKFLVLLLLFVISTLAPAFRIRALGSRHRCKVRSCRPPNFVCPGELTCERVGDSFGCCGKSIQLYFLSIFLMSNYLLLVLPVPSPTTVPSAVPSAFPSMPLD